MNNINAGLIETLEKTLSQLAAKSKRATARAQSALAELEEVRKLLDQLKGS